MSFHEVRDSIRDTGGHAPTRKCAAKPMCGVNMFETLVRWSILPNASSD
jgi:hypothetical protein